MWNSKNNDIAIKMFTKFVNKILETWKKWENKSWKCRVQLIHELFWYEINKKEKCWKCDLCIWEKRYYPDKNKVCF